MIVGKFTHTDFFSLWVQILKLFCTQLLFLRPKGNPYSGSSQKSKKKNNFCDSSLGMLKVRMTLSVHSHRCYTECPQGGYWAKIRTLDLTCVMEWRYTLSSPQPLFNKVLRTGVPKVLKILLKYSGRNPEMCL